MVPVHCIWDWCSFITITINNQHRIITLTCYVIHAGEGIQLSPAVFHRSLQNSKTQTNSRRKPELFQTTPAFAVFYKPDAVRDSLPRMPFSSGRKPPCMPPLPCIIPGPPVIMPPEPTIRLFISIEVSVPPVVRVYVPPS